jgi:trimeric autotransporter adhesin
MLNSQLVWGDADYDVFSVTFIDEKCWLKGTGATYQNTNSGSIVNRNTAGSLIAIDGLVIVNRAVNDVAMTVLPNAPIDAATGLPVPTIAVATDGGVSVIKDDGSVVDLTWSTDVFNHVRFTQDSKLIASGVGWYGIGYVPTVDTDFNTGWTGKTGVRNFGSYGGNSADFMLVGGATVSAVSNGKDRGIASGGGLTLLSENETPANGMVAYVTSDYNTGWMHDDIKLAILSDTDATNVTGAELVTNGDGSTTTGWTAYGSTLSSSSGAINVADNGGYSKAYQAITTVVGKRYTVTAEVTAVGGSNAVLSAGSNTPESNSWGTSTGAIITASPAILSGTFTANATTMYVQLGSESTYTSSFKNVSVRLAEEDRSVNGKGLQVFGTITKTAVATGADLVAYSGFSASNYLQQPYNSGLNFGTGEYAFITWFNMPSNSTQKYIASRGTADGAESMRVAVGNNGVYFDYGNGNQYLSTNTTVSSAVWNCLVCTVKAGQLGYVYINGVEQTYSYRAAAPATFPTASDYDLTIGQSHDGAAPWDGSLALFRISATAPSAAQIAKIYNDEKYLFQAGAQATLYGASDAVTALAYDDDTELLHVGTSAGRSVFQGLRRINNTTDAVGVAISASNGMVVED